MVSNRDTVRCGTNRTEAQSAKGPQGECGSGESKSFEETERHRRALIGSLAQARWRLGGSVPPEETGVADIPRRRANYGALKRIESYMVRLTESHGNREVESDISITAHFQETGIRVRKSCRTRGRKGPEVTRYIRTTWGPSAGGRRLGGSDPPKDRSGVACKP